MFKKIHLTIVFTFGFYAAFSTENILLLNSYHIGFSWTDAITDAVKYTVNNNGNLNLYVEFLDSKRFSDSAHYKEFNEYLRIKYRDIPLKVIITSDNDALDFVLKYRIHSERNIPVVFCGISNYQDYDIEKENLFGVLETDDWEPILKCIVSIHKEDFKKFYFIVENSPTGLIRKKSVERVFDNFNDHLKVIYIENFGYEELIDQIRNISGKSIIYYPGIGVDYYNNPVNAGKCGLAIVKNAKVPVYTSYMSVIDSGAVGGYVASGREQGLKTADLALTLINTPDISKVTRITIPQREFVFNFDVVKKFGLDLNSIPKGSVFVHKPQSVFIMYQKESIALLIFILVLFLTIILLIFNIIRRIRAEKRIRESEKKFREISEMLPETVFECDLKGKIIFINKFGRESFGYTKEEFANKLNIYNLISSKEHFYITQNIQKLVNRGDPLDIIFTAVRKDGSTFPFEIHSTLILRNDQPVGIRGIGINVTRQKRFEKELIEAKKKAEESDRLKSAFLANMSHEIRTPLNSIVGFSYLLSERTLDEDEIKKMSGYIKNSSDHLLMLINDIIDISKIEAGQLDINIQELEVSEVIEEISIYLDKEKVRTEKQHIEINVINKIEEKKLTINSDILRLKQILLNLVSNALKFTEEGNIEIGCYTKDTDVIFYVKDTGIGISEEFKEKLFQRFTKISSFNGKIYPGFGLGLAISKQLTEMLKGKLWCEINKEGGSTFFLSMPVNHR